MRDMSADHAAFDSLLARCQPTTCSAVQAMSTTQDLPSQIPSTWTTWWASSQIGAIGQIDQNREVRRRNVRSGIPSPPCGSLERSHLRKSASSLAELSILCVAVAPQDVHCQRFEPAAVLPWPFILPPHTGHLKFAMGQLNGIARRAGNHAPIRQVKRLQGTRFGRPCSLPHSTAKRRKEASTRRCVE